MSLHNLMNDRPNPHVILEEAKKAIIHEGYDELIVIVMKPDSDLINWSNMPISHLAYAAALLNKALADRI